MTERDRRELDDILAIARDCGPDLSASSAPFGSISTIPTRSESRTTSLSRVRGIFDRVVVFRPGHVLSRHLPHEPVAGASLPSIPWFPTACALASSTETELFAAIEVAAA